MFFSCFSFLDSSLTLHPIDSSVGTRHNRWRQTRWWIGSNYYLAVSVNSEGPSLVLDVPSVIKRTENSIRFLCFSATTEPGNVFVFVTSRPLTSDTPLTFRHRASSILGQAFHYLIFAWPCIIDINNIDNNKGLLIIPVSSTCFGQLFCPSSGALDCVLQSVV